MKNLFKVLLTTLLFTGAVSAADFNAEVFANHAMTLTKNATPNNGTYIDRVRLFAGHKFNDDWDARVRVDLLASGANSLDLREAVFNGRNILMSGDLFKIGAQNHAFHGFFYGFMKTRWIDKNAGHGEKQFAAWQTALSYKASFSKMFSATVFLGSNQASGSKDQDDVESILSASFQINPMDNFSILASYGTETKDQAENEMNTEVAVRWMNDFAKLYVEYHSAKTKSGEADKVMGVTTHIMHKAKVGFFASMRTGYDNPTLDATNSVKKSVITLGPTTKIAEKISAGLFYSSTGYQNGTAATAATIVKENDATLTFKMSAKF